MKSSEGNLSENARIKRIVRLMELLMDNETDPETKTKIRDWFAKGGATSTVDEGIAGYIETVEADNQPLTGETLRRYNAIALKLGLPLEIAPAPVRKTHRIPHLWRVAAVLIPFIAIIGAVALLSDWFSSERESIHNPVHIAALSDSQRHITLPDGTEVWLNAGTILDYEREFEDNRLVEISGEGFFDVAGLGGKPFVVRTSSLEVTVTGTRFDVRDYGTESSAEITLLSGSVDVEAGSKRVSLSPSDRLTMDKSSRTIEVSTVEDIGTVVDWRSAASFEGATLEKVLEYLASHYNVVISVEGDLPTDPVHIFFDHNTRLHDALSALCATFETITYEITPGGILIKPLN